MFKHVIKEESRFPANMQSLGSMRDFVAENGRKHGLSDKEINAFKLAIDEAATNVIRHAYRDWTGEITLRMLIRDGSVTVSLIDQGHNFDLRKVKDPDLQRYVQIGKKGGLGIFIIRRMIDQIDYRKVVEGNELRLTKKRKSKNQGLKGFAESTFTMKTRFSMVASISLTVLAAGIFAVNFPRTGAKAFNDQIGLGRVLAKTLSRNVMEYLLQDQTLELSQAAAKIQRDNAPLVVEALVNDSADVIQTPSKLYSIFETYQPPGKNHTLTFDAIRYAWPGRSDIVDLAAPIVSDAPRYARIGSVHMLLDHAVMMRKVSQARIRFITTFGIILTGAYLGIFLLVYLTMSPFKKLATWIKNIDTNGVPEEMQFNSSDEIGEIAQAFNEITEKFRKSQENLADQERLQKEMEVAQEIQHTLLPSSFPDVEGYEIASYYEAAKEVGGDYFDFVEVDKNTLGIVVADVSGKGVPGSLVMTMIRTALRTEARGNKNPADVLAKVNDFVMNDMKRGMFVTVFYLILDSQNRVISYASAGHNPMILYRGSTQRSYYLNPRGFPLGISLPDNTLFHNSIQSESLHLREGDILILYTDGITEAMNPQREQFGDERFLSVIRQNSGLQVDAFVEQIKNEIIGFTTGFAQSDDITLVSIREKMKSEDVLFNVRSKLMHLVRDEKMSVKEACKIVGVSPSTYYKYKKRFSKMGTAGLREQNPRSEIEERHISIEDKARIYHIIKTNPEFGAKRISEELNTEVYGFTLIDEQRIYDELVRSRLNTKELRQAFIEKAAKGKRLKPPGTPMLTLDGQVIIENKVRKSAAMPDSEARPAFIIQATQKPALEPIKPPSEAETESVLDLEIQETVDAPMPQTEEAASEPIDILSGEIPEPPAEALEPEMDFLGELEPESSFLIQDHEEESAVQSEPQVAESLEETSHPEDDLFDIGFSVDSEWENEIEDQPDTLETILETGGDLPLEGVSIADNMANTSVGDLVAEAITETPESDDTLDDADYGLDENKWAGHRIDHFESGRELYREGLYVKAIEAFWKAIAEDPNYTEAYQCMGDTFFRMGRLDKAKEAYEMVKQLDPDNLSVLENLGVIFANKGDYKRAVWQWAEVLKRNPERRDIIERIRRMQRVIRQRMF